MELVKEKRYRAALSRVKKKRNRYDRLQRIIQNEAWFPGLVIEPSSPSFGPISGNKATKSNDNDSRRTLQYTIPFFFFSLFEKETRPKIQLSKLSNHFFFNALFFLPFLLLFLHPIDSFVSNRYPPTISPSLCFSLPLFILL